MFRSMLLMSAICYTFGAVDINKYLKTCNRNSPDVGDCLVDAVTEGIQIMSNGIPDLGVPNTDPYLEKEFRFDYERNQIAATITMNNVKVAGLKRSTVKDARLKSDDDKFHMEIDMFSPRIEISGSYTGAGGYNTLFVNTSGHFSLNMTDLTYTWKLDGKPENRNGQTYAKIHDFYMHPDVSSLQADLSNNDPNFDEIVRLGVRLANENWRTLYKEFLPYAQASWNTTGVKIANKIFQKVPYDELFPNK